jgi:hypothetical protein
MFIKFRSGFNLSFIFSCPKELANYGFLVERYCIKKRGDMVFASSNEGHVQFNIEVSILSRFFPFFAILTSFIPPPVKYMSTSLRITEFFTRIIIFRADENVQKSIKRGGDLLL